MDRALETGASDDKLGDAARISRAKSDRLTKKAIFEAVSRISATGATLDHDGVFIAMNLGMSQLSSEPVITLPAADDDFHGEIEFELNTGLLELMRSAKDPKTLSPLRLMKRRLFRG